MKWFRAAATCLVLLIPSIAHASDHSLQELGALMLTGRSAEARPQLEKLRDTFAAEGKKEQEAATWLLLGLIDSTLNNKDAAVSNMRGAADKFRAVGDHFGAWLSLYTIAMLEAGSGSTEEATKAYEAVFDELRTAAEPDARFSMETLKMLGGTFGANTDMMGPIAPNPEIFKPVMLRFAHVASHDSFAKLLIDAGELDRAEDELRQAAEASALFFGFFDGNIFLHYGQLRQQQWRLDDAHEYYVKSLKHAQTFGPMFTPPAVASDPWIELHVLRNLAELDLLRGRLDDALVWNDRALKLAQDRNNRKREARVLRSRADLLQNGGRYDEALAVYADALKLAIKLNDVELQAEIHCDLGTAQMFNGSYGTAATHLEKSIALYQVLNQPYVEAPIWIMLAEVYTLLEADSNADIALENAKKLAERSGFKAARAMVDVLATARKVMSGRGAIDDYDIALQALLQTPEAKTMLPSAVTSFMRDSFVINFGIPIEPTDPTAPGMPPFLGSYYAILQGTVAFKQNDYEKARRHFNDALARNPNAETKAGLFALIGATYWKEAKGAEAIRSFHKASDELDAVAGGVKVEELLTSFLGSNRRVYFDVLIEMLVSEGHSMEAFAQAERARARAFLQVVGNHRLNAAAGADPRLVTEAENVRAVIAAREKELMSATPEDARRLLDELKRAREHYRAVVIRMKATNPEYADLANVAPRELDTIGADLPADTTLVSYFVSTHAVHAWVVDREGTQYELLPIRASDLQSLTCWAEQLGSTDARGVTSLANNCAKSTATPEDAYHALFAPLRKHIKHERLFLVPHGVLHYIPFAALRNPETNRYLVQDYTLLFTPSASAIRFLRAKETPVDGSVLVLGDPATPLSLEPLPGAKQEADFVARTLKTTAHLGADANESLLYGLHGKVDLVHLAAHAIYEPADPLFSRVALAAADQQDGSLTVNEILASVDLKGVNLVVLSACRSAVGQRTGGDELVGLTRALLYAGTPGVISTLWNINDAASANLMKDFYRQLATGMSVAEALRHAQLAAIESGDHHDPKYWAAFMLTGDPQGRWKTADAGATEAQ